MGHFWTEKNIFWSFLSIYPLGFAEIELDVAVCIFKEWDIFGPQKAKMQRFHKVYSFDCSVTIFFIFQHNFDHT